MKPKILWTAAVLSMGLPIGLHVHAAYANPDNAIPYNNRVLTLNDAITQALETSPRLKMAQATISANIAGERQAAAWSNPEFALEVENFGGGGAYRRFQSAEISYSLSQTIELGGKRQARRAVAAGDRRIAEIQAERQQLDLLHDVTVAYGNVLSMMERYTLAQDQSRLADEVTATVRRYVDAARDPLVQLEKAELARTTSSIALAQADRDLSTAKYTLAALIGLDLQGIAFDASVLAHRPALPSIGDLRNDVASSPDLAIYDLTAEKGRATLAAEKAQAIPDPNVTLGFRQFEESGHNAFLLGVSIPIPVVNRNQGNIERARQEIVYAESERMQSARDLERAVMTAYQTAQMAEQEARLLETSALPQAEKALKLSREGYERGRFDYLEVLDSQRTLHDLQIQIIDNRNRSFIARAELDRLSARHRGLIEGRR